MARPRDLARSRIYDDLRRRILCGDLRQGQPLVVSALAASVGASRTPVREALVRLLSAGLVVETPSGLAVKTVTEDELLEVYEVRIPLEALAARLAATNRTPGQLARIQALHEGFVAAAERPDADPESLARLNILLHRAICDAARNPLLADFLGRIYDVVGGLGTTTYSRPGRPREAATEHQGLFAALASRDPDQAEEVARQHMSQAFSARLAMYREAQALRPA
jgi:DNA-binding GntR family transcriptional regulator